MTPSAAGKGDDCRIANFKQYRDNYDNIFKKKKVLDKTKTGQMTMEELKECFTGLYQEDVSEILWQNADRENMRLLSSNENDFLDSLEGHHYNEPPFYEEID